MSRSGLPYALGAVGVLALAGALAPRRGSRATLADFLQQHGASPQGQVVGTTRPKVNAAAMWTLAAEKLYGSYVDVPVVATREALQNSRDAIRDAIKAGEIQEGVFKVEWDPEIRTLVWDDNGIGMSREIVDTKFLSLGDTTKLLTASRQDVQAGGFGLAKALLLGASSTFTWVLDTRDHRFTAKDFDTDIQIRRAPYRQGLRLAVNNVAKKYDRYWSQGRMQSTPARITSFLATNQTAFPIFYNGIRVPYAFSGKGTVVEEGADWGPGTTGTVTVYKRGQDGGNLYVRLVGLTQFSTSLADGKAEFDVIVDLTTKIQPKEDGYPFTASRMSLSGPAEQTLARILGQFNVDVLSSIRGPEPELTGEDEVDPQKRAATEGQMAAILQNAADDPAIRSILATLGQTGDAIRQDFRQVERQIPPQRQTSLSTAGQTPEAFQRLAETVVIQQRPPEAKPQAARPKRSDGGSNPFAGAGKLKINHAQWDKKRLAPYLKNPSALLPLLALWRLAVQLVYAEVYGRAPDFTVGFLFDDSTRAEYDARNNRLFSINPVPVLKLAQALPDNPAVIAAYLHNKACHEVTHALGLSKHDETFVSKRESVADRTAQLLAPLTLLTALLLGMKGAAAPAAPKKPRKKPEAKVKMRKSWGRGADARIFERMAGEKTSPLYGFAVEFARLFSEAGFPTQMDEEHTPKEDFKIRLYPDVVDSDGYNTQIALTFYKDDVSGPGFYSKEWRDVLTPAQLDALREDTPTLIPLASQAVAFLQKTLAEGGYRKRGSGSSNRTPRSRRALLRQAEAILARG
jgi:hypothetical protein